MAKKIPFFHFLFGILFVFLFYTLSIPSAAGGGVIKSFAGYDETPTVRFSQAGRYPMYLGIPEGSVVTSLNISVEPPLEEGVPIYRLGLDVGDDGEEDWSFGDRYVGLVEKVENVGFAQVTQESQIWDYFLKPDTSVNPTGNFLIPPGAEVSGTLGLVYSSDQIAHLAVSPFEDYGDLSVSYGRSQGPRGYHILYKNDEDKMVLLTYHEENDTWERTEVSSFPEPDSRSPFVYPNSTGVHLFWSADFGGGSVIRHAFVGYGGGPVMGPENISSGLVGKGSVSMSFPVFLEYDGEPYLFFVASFPNGSRALVVKNGPLQGGSYVVPFSSGVWPHPAWLPEEADARPFDALSGDGRIWVVFPNSENNTTFPWEVMTWNGTVWTRIIDPEYNRTLSLSDISPLGVGIGKSASPRLCSDGSGIRLTYITRSFFYWGIFPIDADSAANISFPFRTFEMYVNNPWEYGLTSLDSGASVVYPRERRTVIDTYFLGRGKESSFFPSGEHLSLIARMDGETYHWPFVYNGISGNHSVVFLVNQSGRNRICILKIQPYFRVSNSLDKVVVSEAYGIVVGKRSSLIVTGDLEEDGPKALTVSDVRTGQVVTRIYGEEAERFTIVPEDSSEGGFLLASVRSSSAHQVTFGWRKIAGGEVTLWRNFTVDYPYERLGRSFEATVDSDGNIHIVMSMSSPLLTGSRDMELFHFVLNDTGVKSASPLSSSFSEAGVGEEKVAALRAVGGRVYLAYVYDAEDVSQSSVESFLGWKSASPLPPRVWVRVWDGGEWSLPQLIDVSNVSSGISRVRFVHSKLGADRVGINLLLADGFLCSVAYAPQSSERLTFSNPVFSGERSSFPEVFSHSLNSSSSFDTAYFRGIPYLFGVVEGYLRAYSLSGEWYINTSIRAERVLFAGEVGEGESVYVVYECPAEENTVKEDENSVCFGVTRLWSPTVQLRVKGIRGVEVFYPKLYGYGSGGEEDYYYASYSWDIEGISGEGEAFLTDEFGNPFTAIRMEIESNTTGHGFFHSFEEIAYHAHIPIPSLADVVNEYLFSHRESLEDRGGSGGSGFSPSENNLVYVPFVWTARSEGSFVISRMSVEYDYLPYLVGSSSGNYSAEEDKPFSLSLDEIFSDEESPSELDFLCSSPLFTVSDGRLRIVPLHSYGSNVSTDVWAVDPVTGRFSPPYHVNVNITEVNEAPFQTAPLVSRIVDEDTTWSVDLRDYFDDEEYPDGMVFISTADEVHVDGSIASWTPRHGSSSISDLRFLVIDGADSNLTLYSLPFTLKYREVNDAPFLKVPFGDLRVREGDVVEVDLGLHFADEESGRSLDYSASVPWAELTRETIMELRPPHVGSFSLTFTARDPVAPSLYAVSNTVFVNVYKRGVLDYINENEAILEASAMVMTVAGGLFGYWKYHKKNALLYTYLERIKGIGSGVVREHAGIELNELRDELLSELMSKRLNEEHYLLLVNELDERIKRFSTDALTEFGGVPSQIFHAIGSILADGKVTKEEYSSFVSVLEKETSVPAREKERIISKLREFMEDKDGNGDNAGNREEGEDNEE